MKGGDLLPVAGLLHVQRGDRRLQDVRTGAAEGDGAIENDPARRDLLAIPARAVLLCEEHQLAVDPTSIAASVVQQHQSHQAVRLGLVGHQLGERTTEPDGFGGELTPAAVPLVEDQVDDCENRSEALGKQVIGRHPERDPGCLDFVLRPHEALGHRRHRDEEGAGDLLGREASELAQGQGHLRLRRKRGMAAREDELQALVGEGHLVHFVLRGFGDVQLAELALERPPPPDLIDGAIPRRGDQPGRRVGRLALARPALRGRRERLLSGLLGEIEVAEEADEGRENTAPVLTEGLFENR